MQLDLSENRLRVLENISPLLSLQTLNVAKNHLESASSIADLASCKSLTNVDLSANALAGEDVISVLGSIPTLVATNCDGNPMCREVASFRKRMIGAVKKLRYLDRPVFEAERAGAEAWAVGGYEAEKLVRQEFAEKKKQEDKDSMQSFRDWQTTKRKEKEEEMKKNPELVAREREEREAAKAAREEEARRAALEEKQVYSIDNDVAGQAGREFWNERQEKDAFGHVRRTVPAPAVPATGNSAIWQDDEAAEAKQSPRDDDDDSNAPSKVDEIFSFQGAKPGSTRAPNIEKKAPPPPASEAKRSAEPDVKERIFAAAEKNLPQDEDGGASGSDSDKDDQHVLKARDTNVDSDDERQRRVDESFAIYKEQRDAKAKAKAAAAAPPVFQPTFPPASQPSKAAAPPPSASAVPPVTAEDATASFSKLLLDAKAAADAEVKGKGASRHDANAFFWTEAMDVKLASQVHACAFDFAAVSKKLKATLTPSDLEGLSAALVTGEACRMRWCELDVDDEGMSNGAPQQTSRLPKIMLGEKGEQLSFHELQRHINSQPNSLLKPPTALPTFEDNDEDEDDENVVVMTADALRAKFAKGGITNFESLD